MIIQLYLTELGLVNIPNVSGEKWKVNHRFEKTFNLNECLNIYQAQGMRFINM